MFAILKSMQCLYQEPVELLEESVWTAGMRRTGNDTGEEVLCFLEFGDVFLSGSK